MLFLSLVTISCDSEQLDNVATTTENSVTSKKREFNYTNDEILKISSILLSDETLDDFANKKSLIINELGEVKKQKERLVFYKWKRFL